MPLSTVIRPGDPLDADQLATLFGDLATDVNDVQPAMIKRGSIRGTNLTGDCKLLDTEPVAGPLAPAALAKLAPALSVDWPVYTGELVVARFQTRVVATGAGHTCHIQIRIAGAPVMDRYYTLANGDRRTFEAFWCFEAVAATSLIELWGAGNNNSFFIPRVDVLSVNR